jgi:hypothetical protein
MVWCCLQKTAFVRSIKVQIILIKSLKKNNTQIKKSIYFVALQANPCLRPPHCCFCITNTHTHTHTHTHTLGLLRTSDHLVAKAATYITHNKHNGQHPTLSGIRTRDPSNQAISGPRFRPRDHRDRPTSMFTHVTETGKDDFELHQQNDTTLQHI